MLLHYNLTSSENWWLLYNARAVRLSPVPNFKQFHYPNRTRCWLLLVFHPLPLKPLSYFLSPWTCRVWTFPINGMMKLLAIFLSGLFGLLWCLQDSSTFSALCVMVLLLTALLSGPCEIRLCSHSSVRVGVCFVSLAAFPVVEFLPCGNSVRNLFFNYIFHCACIYVWICTYECRCPQVLQASNASKPELQALASLLTWVLGMKLRSSARAVYLSLATEPSMSPSV